MKEARKPDVVWLNGAEAAEYVGLSWTTLRQLIQDHQIPHLRVGSRWKINVDTLDTHLHRLAEAQVDVA